MIIIVNFNSYLGGGETLVVRFSEYLSKKDIEYKVLCLKGSYIAKDLRRINIPDINIAEIDNNPNYYYLSDSDRSNLLRILSDYIPKDEESHVISFCSRDLYTLIDLKKIYPNLLIIHLILHDQDNLYVCQSLLDKIKAKFFHKQSYSRKSQIAFNSYLYNLLSEHDCAIPQCDLQVPLWRNDFGIDLSYSAVVPLPVCDFSSITPVYKSENGKKILWVGRIVDFKIPALCAMISFVNRHRDYSLTVVGDGDRSAVDCYISANSIITTNIKFVGQVDYSQLPPIIRNHDIGYAMGTSIIEIAKFGIPVIMALATPKKRIFKNEICGGLYVDVAKGNVGENLYCGQSEDEQVLIEDAILQIEADYKVASRLCFNCVRSMFDFETNIVQYLSIIKNSSNFSVSEINIPKSSKLRRKLFYQTNKGR